MSIVCLKRFTSIMLDFLPVQHPALAVYSAVLPGRLVHRAPAASSALDSHAVPVPLGMLGAS